MSTFKLVMVFVLGSVAVAVSLFCRLSGGEWPWGLLAGAGMAAVVASLLYRWVEKSVGRVWAMLWLGAVLPTIAYFVLVLSAASQSGFGDLSFSPSAFLVCTLMLLKSGNSRPEANL